MVMSTKSIFALALLVLTLPAVADTLTVSNQSRYTINITNQSSGGDYHLFQGQSRTLEGDSVALNWFKINPVIPLVEPFSPESQFSININATGIKRSIEVTILGDIFNPKIKTVTTVFNPAVEIISQTYTLNHWQPFQSSDTPAATWQPQP